MSDFPTLKEMGINNPQEIDRYSLQTINESMDILRIVYKRQKGSLLPSSKRFRFGRSERILMGEDETKSPVVHYEISPFVRKAMAELDKIVQSKRDRNYQLQVIREEMQRLQEDTTARMAYIQELVDELK